MFCFATLLQIDILREILSRSGDTLRILHVEHVTALDRELLGKSLLVPVDSSELGYTVQIRNKTDIVPALSRLL